MTRNNSIAGSIIGLTVFLGFGVFFLLGFSPFSFFSIVPFFPMIFIIVIIGIVGAASARSKRSNCCSQKSYKPYNQYQNYTEEVPRSNPYNVRRSGSSVVRPIYIEDAEPEDTKANFCQYCGSKKDKSAIYCHSCGSKL